MLIQKNVSLARYTTFKIGGPAKFFCQVKTKQELKNLIKKYPKYYILGNGSNLLISDRGYSGLIIKLLNTKYKILNTKIHAGAGVNLAKIVRETEKNNLTGLEWAVGIPGTIAGAIAVNASAFGSCMQEITKKTEKINNIIWSADLQLKRGFKRDLLEQYLDYRKKTQPIGYACAGCIFKNPKGQSAGRLIDQAGLKGTRIGGAQISKKHANFILNLKNAQAKDIIALIKLAKKAVKKKFNIDLELEINLLGFDSF
ncbi:MAG: FAD-binding protein [bacterium]